MSTPKEQAATLRLYRRIHKYTGLFLALAFLLLALTGILLAWKKESAWIQPPTQKAENYELAQWLPLDKLAAKGQGALKKQLELNKTPSIDRLDVRPGKGIVKVLFEEGYWEVQLNGTTGEVLSVARRHSDWIEALHDGSIVSDFFKIGYSSLAAVVMVLLAVTGFWLWFGPKRLRRQKLKEKLRS